MNKKSEIIANLINDGGSARFARVIAIVEQKMKKTGNPLKNEVVTKLVEYQMLLNANYSNLVNNALKRENKEANFVAKDNWFTKVNDGFNGSIVAKKSDTTCQYLFFACNQAKTQKYFINGIEAQTKDIEVIKQFKQTSSAPHQGLNDEIIVRTIKIEGIKEIKSGDTIIFG